MSCLLDHLKQMKCLFEKSILENGLEGKTSLIRSSDFINILHEAIKKDLVSAGIDGSRILPPINSKSPEMKVAGFLKRKDQDVCVIPKGINQSKRKITWGPEASENLYDEYGEEFTKHTLIINVRSQMSSLAKNTDTLFERTFAEPFNLHLVYPDLVLGDVYLIPVYEYEQGTMKERKISFVKHHTDLAKYISFFASISGRKNSDSDLYMYERCALLIVDFRPEVPKIFHSTQDLIEDGLLPPNFNVEYADISYDRFIEDLLTVYDERFDAVHIKKGTEYF